MSSVKQILAVGDSFTFGEELKTVFDAYPNLITNYYNGELVNLAKPGTGNRRMIRNIIDHISSGHHVDLVIIGWTSPGRMEFADDDGIFDIWPGYRGTMYIDNQPWRLDLLEYINKYHNSQYIYYNFLLDVILIQNYLEKNNINYIMSSICMNEYYHNIYYSKMELITPLVNPKYFIGWPEEGMAEWTLGCKKGPRGHFLTDGHRRVADKLIDYINKYQLL